MMRLCTGLAIVLMLGACGGTPAVPREAHEVTQAEREKRAAELAPDLYAKAQEAKARAAEASGDAQDDLELTAELWLEAACEEADRIVLERKRREHEARIEAAQLARAGLDKQRLELEAAIRRDEAARIAHTEAVKMLALAATDERPRPAGDTAHAEVAAWLVSRAELTLAAARAIGLPEPEAAEVAAAIGRARKPKAKLEDAQGALASAERAIGRARALRGPVTEDERAALLEMASERSLSATRDARGVVLDLRSAFTPGTAKLSANGRAQLAHLLALARAHPHGPIHIEASRARAEALHKALGDAPERARFSVVAQDLPDKERVFVVLVEYGER